MQFFVLLVARGRPTVNAMIISEIKERAKTWGAPGIIPQITATATSKPCARPPDSRGGTMAGIAIQ